MRTSLMIILSLLVLQKARSQESRPGYFQFTYSNDYFTATDYYFTQGIRLEGAAPLFRFTPLAPLLLHFKHDPAVLHRFFVAQDGFTPTSIRADTILRGDRPYAGALYLGQKLISLQEAQGLQLSAELQIGVLGPWALVGEEQTYIHRQTGNVQPMGWDYQIRNDLLLNYQLELNKQLYYNPWLAISGGAHAWLGTYRDRTGLQGRLTLGWINNDFSHHLSTKKSRFFFFANARLSLVAYDATLQGGLFNRNSVYKIPARDVQRFPASAELGAQLQLGKLQIAFSHTYLSREFRGGRPHAWGTARIRIGF